MTMYTCDTYKHCIGSIPSTFPRQSHKLISNNGRSTFPTDRPVAHAYTSISMTRDNEMHRRRFMHYNYYHKYISLGGRKHQRELFAFYKTN